MTKLTITKIGIATVVITTLLLLGTGIGTGTIAPVSAQRPEPDPARGGLDRADVNVHENTDSTPDNLSEQDLRFHEGLCQGGHSTTVVDREFGGCGALDPPGGPPG
jgi:hypothetical protein